MKSSKKNKISLLIFSIIYIIVGFFIYNYIKKYYSNSEVGFIDKCIMDAVEITDEYGLKHVLDSNESTYALIYGTIDTVDPIHSIFLGDDFSYIRESIIEFEDIKGGKVQKSEKFSIYGIPVDGLNLSFINPYVVKEIKDVKNKDILYRYEVVGLSYTGTLLCKIESGKISDIINFYEYKSINEINRPDKKNVILKENFFLVLWGLGFIMIILSKDDYYSFDD